MDNFSLARPAGQLIMGDGSGPDGLAKKDGAKALSGAASVDTATTQVDKSLRTKSLITEFEQDETGIGRQAATIEVDFHSFAPNRCREQWCRLTLGRERRLHRIETWNRGFFGATSVHVGSLLKW